jgi:hypothetical protein
MKALQAVCLGRFCIGSSGIGPKKVKRAGFDLIADMQILGGEKNSFFLA